MTFEYYAWNSATATTTTTKNHKQLTLETVPKTQRKYLGEPDDPHFIPKSPLIQRQSLTEQEEGELKRLCALALAEVPHSDGPDPVVLSLAPRTAAVTAQKAPVPVRDVIKPPQPQFADDSRTPSEASRRDTLGTVTDYSTPLTSAGITPGEQMKSFSSSKTQNSSTLRYEQWQQLQQRVKSHTHPQPSKNTQRVESQPHTESRKSAASVPGERTLRFVKDSPRDTSPSAPSKSKSKSQSPDPSRPDRFSQAELNKQLPPLPKDDDNDSSSSSKPPPLARMLKTITRKKSSLHDEEAMPFHVERPGGSSMSFTRSAPASPAVASDGGRRRFMKLFGRKERHDVPGSAIPAS